MTHPSPIISPDDLFARLGAADLRIVDVRSGAGSPGAGRLGYEAGHLPGAIFLDLDTDLTAVDGPGRQPLQTRPTSPHASSGPGIANGDEVVTYDDVGGWIAARLWWMLDDLGHHRVRVLDGGLPAWVAAGHPVTTDLPEPRPRGHLRLRGTWTNVIDRDAVVNGYGELVLLDARGGQRYRGEIEPINPVPGHIPTARSAPADGNVGADDASCPARRWSNGSRPWAPPPTAPGS